LFFGDFCELVSRPVRGRDRDELKMETTQAFIIFGMATVGLGVMHKVKDQIFNLVI
jgi:hypothetical protein